MIKKGLLNSALLYECLVKIHMQNKNKNAPSKLISHHCDSTNLSEHTAWTVKIVLNSGVVDQFVDKKELTTPKLIKRRSTTPKLILKNRVDNKKFNTNLTVQALVGDHLFTLLSPDFYITYYTGLFKLIVRWHLPKKIVLPCTYVVSPNIHAKLLLIIK